MKKSVSPSEEWECMGHIHFPPPHQALLGNKWGICKLHCHLCFVKPLQLLLFNQLLCLLLQLPSPSKRHFCLPKILENEKKKNSNQCTRMILNVTTSLPQNHRTTQVGTDLQRLFNPSPLHKARWAAACCFGQPHWNENIDVGKFSHINLCWLWIITRSTEILSIREPSLSIKRSSNQFRKT